MQRCHEVARVRQRRAETTGGEVTAQMVFDVYQKNLAMVPGAAGTVTLNFCDNASSIVRSLFEVLAIHAVLLEADAIQGLRMGSNAFDSHSRLNAILGKTGTNVEHRLWVVEGHFFMMKNGRFIDKDVSVAEFRGCSRTGNRGLCELLIYKLALKRQDFQREVSVRAAGLLINTDVPFSKWLEN